MGEKDTSDEEFEPVYQKGMTSVEHRNIDAAGDDHPFGEDAQAFEADLRHLIRKVADDLYQSWEATFREYLANAETACLKAQHYAESPEQSPYDDMIVEDSYQPKVEVVWDIQEERVTIQDNGIGMAAAEVDEIFRQVGHSAARDDGTQSGQFGMGALSFVKTVGLDNAMIMTSHSRLNDDNAAYYVTLAGVEPIMGSLPEDQYGTRFQMTPNDSYPIREAIEKYAAWMRVPVRYEEIGPSGVVAFQEDYGNRKLYEDFEDHRICLGSKLPGAYEAYCSPDSNAQTLLLSMEIDRNDGRYHPNQHAAPFGFDVRILDESGKVIESSNGNEGLMPTARSDYVSMLKEARPDHITEPLLNNGDIIGQTVEAGPNSGKVVVKDSVLEAGKPLPSAHDYMPKSEVTQADVPGDSTVIFGPNQGRTVVSEDVWESMDAGRASLYIPDDELESYDIETGEGDLALPQPTSDRDRLQSHEVFWEYIGKEFARQFDEKVHEVYESIDSHDDVIDAVMSMQVSDIVVTPEGFKE